MAQGLRFKDEFKQDAVAPNGQHKLQLPMPFSRLCVPALGCQPRQRPSFPLNLGP